MAVVQPVRCRGPAAEFLRAWREALEPRWITSHARAGHAPRLWFLHAFSAATRSFPVKFWCNNGPETKEKTCDLWRTAADQGHPFRPRRCRRHSPSDLSAFCRMRAAWNVMACRLSLVAA